MALNQPRPISSRMMPVAHLDRAHQHQHIEDQFAHIVPHDGGCRQRIVRDGGRGRGKGRENHTGQYDDTALQTDGGVAFQKSHADAAGGLSRKAGQRDGCDGRRHIELEKTAIDGQNHDQGQNPDKQGAQQRHRPQGDGVSIKPTSSMMVTISSGSVVADMAVRPEESMMVDTVPWAMRNRAGHQLHAVRYRRLRQHKADKAFEGHFRASSVSVKLPQVLTTPITKNSTNSAYPMALKRVVDVDDDIPDHRRP